MGHGCAEKKQDKLNAYPAGIKLMQPNVMIDSSRLNVIALEARSLSCELPPPLPPPKRLLALLQSG
ncbi:MAG: hypothetical protein RBJ76_08580 [Stenomitos frigidus ULC029]